jgi:hypothetical protein
MSLGWLSRLKSAGMPGIHDLAHASHCFTSMTAWQQSRAAGNSWDDEITKRRDVLAMSRERDLRDDESWPVDVEFDDAWEEPAPVGFVIAGEEPAVVRLRRGRSIVTEAHGVVKRIDEDRLLLGTPGIASHEVFLSYRLPASVDLRGLVGRRVRLTLVDEPALGGGPSQTLTVSTLDGRVWLIARHGGARDVTHTLDGSVVRVSLSQKDGGPLVVAPPHLQHIVAPGGDARMTVGKHHFVVELVSRDDAGHAAYFIADELLWH